MSIEEIIAGCLRNDAKSQEELFRRYSGKMLAVCMRYARHRLEAEDILQDGFIKVFRKLDQFEFKGSFDYWVKRIMINTALKNYRRSFYKNELLGMEDKMEESSQQPEAYSNLVSEDLKKMIDSLPEGYRVVFCLFALEGYSHREIASELNIQESTSRSQLVKARKILQKKIENLKKSVA